MTTPQNPPRQHPILDNAQKVRAAMLEAALLRLGWERKERDGRILLLLPIERFHDHDRLNQPITIVRNLWADPAGGEATGTYLYMEDYTEYRQALRRGIQPPTAPTPLYPPCFYVRHGPLPREPEAWALALAAQLTMYAAYWKTARDKMRVKFEKTHWI